MAGAGAQSDQTPVIGTILINGNHKTDTRIILRELGLREGQPFSAEELDLHWDHLEDLGYFAFVDMDYDEVDPGIVELYIDVVEDKTTRLTPLLDYDRRHKYLLGASLSEINLRGKAEVLELSAVMYRIQRYRARWTRPWLFNVPSLAGTIAGGWERAGFVFRDTDYNQWDVAGRARWSLRGHLYLEGGAGFGGFKQRQTFQEPAPDRGAGSSGPVTRLAGWRERLVFTGEMGLEDRDTPYYPLRGYWHRVRLRHSEGRGFASFDDWTVDLRQFIPTPWKHIVALRAMGRRVSGPVPLEDRLFWGGEETIRGYGYAEMEGEEGYLLTVEYRWPVFVMPISPDGRVIGIGLHVFTDAGDVWYDGDDSGEARLSWGIGAHLNVSSRQFRFEVARTKDGDTAFQFADTFNF